VPPGRQFPNSVPQLFFRWRVAHGLTPGAGHKAKQARPAERLFAVCIGKSKVSPQGDVQLRAAPHHHKTVLTKLKKMGTWNPARGFPGARTNLACGRMTCPSVS
jgi:hypothetical protein